MTKLSPALQEAVDRMYATLALIECQIDELNETAARMNDDLQAWLWARAEAREGKNG